MSVKQLWWSTKHDSNTKLGRAKILSGETLW